MPEPPPVSAEHKWGPPYDRRAILGRIRAVETGGTTGYERKLEAELQAAQEALREAPLPEFVQSDFLRYEAWFRKHRTTTGPQRTEEAGGKTFEQRYCQTSPPNKEEK